MGGIPSVVKKDNKVDPAIEFFTEQAKKRDKRSSPALVSASRRNGQVIWSKPPTGWDAFDVGFKANKGPKQNRLGRFYRNYQKETETGFVLNKEKLLEKQRQAEKNRIKYLETKKKTAASFGKPFGITRECKLEDSKSRKVHQIAQKHAKAAENRKKQIESIKATAKKGVSSAGRRKAESLIHARVQHIQSQLEMKMNITQENRKKIVENVIRKQQLREEHARRVRDKVRQLSLEQVSGIESDYPFCAPVSDQYSSALWNDCSITDLEN